MDAHGDARSSHAEHDAEKLVGEGQDVTVETIVGHQEPAGQTLLKKGSAIRRRGVGRLTGEGVDETEEKLPEFRLLSRASRRFLQTQSPAGNLDVGPVG